MLIHLESQHTRGPNYQWCNISIHSSVPLHVMCFSSCVVEIHGEQADLQSVLRCFYSLTGIHLCFDMPIVQLLDFVVMTNFLQVSETMAHFNVCAASFHVDLSY